MGERRGVSRQSQYRRRHPEQARQYRNQPGKGEYSLQRLFFRQGTSLLIHSGSAKAAA